MAAWDVTCDDCGNDMLDIDAEDAKDGAACDVFGSRNTRVLK